MEFEGKAFKVPFIFYFYFFNKTFANVLILFYFCKFTAFQTPLGTLKVKEFQNSFCLILTNVY
jgi:hypothetical protein